MPTTDFKLEYNSITENKKGVPVVIVAAGSSSRMGGIDKILAKICGIPVIARTMLAFERNKNVSEIVVVTKEESIADIEKLANEYMITKLNAVVKGGNCRLESVENGIALLNDKYSAVLIHDGARPLISDNLISAMAQASLNYDCAVCGTKVKDTLKYVNGEKTETPDRSKIYAVQTPQTVNLKVYKKLLSECSDKSSFTDDASVMEAAGYKTQIIEGEESNLKITTPYDLKLAEFILREEELCE